MRVLMMNDLLNPERQALRLVSWNVNSSSLQKHRCLLLLAPTQRAGTCGQLILFPSIPRTLPPPPAYEKASCEQLLHFLFHTEVKVLEGLAVLEFRESCSNITGTLWFGGLMGCGETLGRG